MAASFPSLPSRCLLLAALGLAVLPGSALARAKKGHAPHYQYTAPRLLVLSKSDVSAVLGGGFTAAPGQVISDQEAGVASVMAGLTSYDFAHQGRLTGYASDFRHQVSTVYRHGNLTIKPGVDEVVSSVSVYKSAAGPRWELQMARTHRLARMRTMVSHLSAPGGIGNAALLETYSSHFMTPNIDGAVVIFARGKYSATITVTSYGPPNTGQALRLARIVDTRLKQAR